MATRLAITIAGAVSLGSYEAGVLYELLRAIRTHNQRAEDESAKIYIDVITGASAGGMTAGIVAQRLMYDAEALEGEFGNALYEAWVENISLLKLVQLGWKEKKWHSLFSSDLIDSIGRQMLVDSMKNSGSGPHAAIEQIDGVPQPIRVGLALTNLNGVDYTIPIVGNPDDGFNYTTSVDQAAFKATGDKKLFKITDDKNTRPADWQDMCEAAVGSGAFPAAFRPKAIERGIEDYEAERLPAEKQFRLQGATYLDWTGESPKPFAFSDGGVLQNQPLGIAKNLVDAATQERVKSSGAGAYAENRMYVFVAPHSVKSSAENLAAGKITILQILKELAHVYFRQATFHDWIVAEGVNQRIRSLDTLAAHLAEMISRELVDVGALLKAAGDLNVALMPYDEAERLARLREQYSAECQKIMNSGAGPNAVKAFINALGTLEATAQLQDYDKMKIVAVTANAQTELAGAGISSFVGFFKKSFREHDYWIGRKKTRTYLQRDDVKAILGVKKWPEEDSWRTDLPNTSGVEKVPPNFLAVASAALIPGVIAAFIRPALLAIVALIIAAGFGLWELLHHGCHLLPH